MEVAEAQGGMIGHDFLVVSGFYQDWPVVTKKVHMLDTSVPSAGWVPMDDVIYSDGVTHAMHVVVGNLFYLCGGWVEGHPGTTTGTYKYFKYSYEPL